MPFFPKVMSGAGIGPQSSSAWTEIAAGALCLLQADAAFEGDGEHRPESALRLTTKSPITKRIDAPNVRSFASKPRMIEAGLPLDCNHTDCAKRFACSLKLAQPPR